MPNNKSAADINLSAMEKPLEKICQNCDLKGTADCVEAACLNGFARKTLKFASTKGVLDIPGAAGIIPAQDFKPYEPELIAEGIAETCRQCRECRDNHSTDCIISLVRSCLENMILTENVDYPGSVFAYLALVKEIDPQMALLLAKHLKK